MLLLSAGVGATPVLAMLHALAAERSTREVWWLHGARDGTEHPFAEECRALLAQLPNAHGHVCYSRPAAADRPGVDYATAGRLTAALLADLGFRRTADAYLCGPPAFMEDLPAALVGLGIDPSRIHTEIFGAGPALTPGHRAGSGAGAAPARRRARHRSVRLLRPQRADRQLGPRYASLLELAEACDVPDPLVLPHGGLPQLRDGLLSGDGRLFARTRRTACRRATR